MQLAAAGHRVTALDRSKSRLADCARISSAPGSRPSWSPADALDWKPTRAVRRDPARRALLGDRHLPPPSRSALPRPARDHRRERRAAGAAARPRRRLARSRAAALVYAVCSLEPEEGEERRRRLPRAQLRTSASTAPGELARRRDANCATACSASCPACSRPKAGSTASSSRALSARAKTRLIAPHGRAAHLPLDPVRRFRPARRGSARDRRGRRRLDPHRRDGRPFRPQPHHRPGGGEGASPAHAPSRSTSI